MRKSFFFCLFVILISMTLTSCGIGSKTEKFEDPYENKSFTIKDSKNWYYIPSNNLKILEKLSPKKYKNNDPSTALTKEDSLYLKNRDVFFRNSFEKPVKINEYKRIFFHHFFLKKETITYGTFFYKGNVCKDVFLLRKTENSYYLFFILFFIFPLSIYMINNHVKIGEKIYSFRDIKENENFKKMMILFFGIGILSIKSEYIFNYFKNILFDYIPPIFYSQILFSFLFLPLFLISIYWAFCLILYLLGFKVFPKRISMSIIVFSSLMYGLFTGVSSGELYFQNLYEVFLSFILFRVIFGFMFIPKMYKHIA